MASNQVTTESLNEVVIRLLALNDGDELSYQTYFERIKKKLFTARLGNKELPREEDELLRNELKRVKKIKDQGLRFKVKKVKVNNRTTTVPPSTGPSTSPQYNNKKSSSAIVKRKDAIVKSKGGEIAPYEGIKPKEKEEDKKEQKGFSNIQRTLDSILSILASKFKFEQKKSDEERRQEETEKRGKRESSLEGFKKGIGAIVSLTKKMLSPFQNIMDRIWRFIFFTLLGRAFTQLMDWLGDPKNKNKIETLSRFLKDWWPTLLGAAVLFFTPFGGFVRSVLGLVGKFAARLPGLIKNIANAVKGLGTFAINNPMAAGVALATIGSIAKIREQERMGPFVRETKGTIKKENENKNTPWYKKLGNVLAGQALTGPTGPGGGPMGLPSPGGMYNSGGIIPSFSSGGLYSFGDGYNGIEGNTGQKVSGFGPDTQMIVAQPGEIVMNKKTVDAVGADTFLALNREYGGPGANKPKINRFNSGGVIIERFNTGGVVGGARRGIRDILGRGVGDWERGTTTLDALRRRNPSDMPSTGRGRLRSSIRPIWQSSYLGRILSGFDPDKKHPDNPNFVGPLKGGGEGTRDRMPGTTPSNSPFTPKIGPNTPGGVNLRYLNQLRLQKGGLVENATNFIQGLFGFGKKPSPPPKPKPKGPLPEFMNPEILALLKTIRAAEHYKGSDPYTSIYGGGNAPITKMTIEEVIDMGNTGRLPKRFGGKSAGYGSGSAATGAYQFMPFTLQDLIRRGLAKPSEMFSSSVQDRLGWELAKGRGVNLGSLRKTGLNQSIMDMMAPEWASFPYSGAGGKSFYGQPVKSPDFLREIFRQSLRSFKGPKKKAGGSIGEVGESEGTNIPGATADRQLFPITSGGFAALQPGEFVMPKKAVQERGLDFMNQLASADSASEAYLMRGKVNGPNITPYRNLGSSGMEGMVTLPPIVAGGTGMNRPRASGLAGGSGVPSFPYRHPNGNHNMHAQIYGIGSMVG